MQYDVFLLFLSLVSLCLHPWGAPEGIPTIVLIKFLNYIYLLNRKIEGEGQRVNVRLPAWQHCDWYVLYYFGRGLGTYTSCKGTYRLHWR